MAKRITEKLKDQPYYTPPTQEQIDTALSGYNVLSASARRTEDGWQIEAEVEDKPKAKAKPKAKSKASASKSKSSKK